jgi:Tail-tube assembly protein
MATNISVLEGKKILQYPLDLGSVAIDPYGQEQQYVMFKINTDSKTTKLRDDAETGKVVSATRVGTGVETQLVVAKNTDKDLKIKNGDAAVDKERWFVQKGMQRLDKVIVLPMPNEHSVGTKMTYEDVDQTMLTQLGDMKNQSTGEMLSELGKLGKNAGLSLIVNKFKSGATNTGALLAEERLALNPKKEVMFKGFGFRNFQFSYTFAPKSALESKMVKDIIETFRYYALPEISPAKLFYIFPSEFEISFMQGQKDNPHIPKITTCVLESISVNYMPRNVWSVLPDGSPLAVSISMQFKELELVDRMRVFNKNSEITGGY